MEDDEGWLQHWSRHKVIILLVLLFELGQQGFISGMRKATNKEMYIKSQKVMLIIKKIKFWEQWSDADERSYLLSSVK